MPNARALTLTLCLIGSLFGGTVLSGCTEEGDNFVQDSSQNANQGGGSSFAGGSGGGEAKFDSARFDRGRFE